MSDITVYLGLGSNLGERKTNLKRALCYLSERMRLEQISSIYDTEPVGDINQPCFLNMVCQIMTTLSPEILLFAVKGIESKMGRLPNTSGKPRIIDIDILFYGDRVVNTPELIIPHPRLAERAFVLAPLAELNPNLLHPVKKLSVQAMLDEVEGKSGVLLVGKMEGIRCTKSP